MSSSKDASTQNPVTIRFELLTARHNDKVAPFDCGNAKITEWLQQEALTAMTVGKYATYVAIEEETGTEAVVGYVAVRADFIRYPPPRKGGYEYVVPVVEIAYLGRDRNWKNREVGVRLVLQGLSVALNVQDAIGGFAGVHLTTTDKGRHLYTGGPIRFDPHPAANSDADYYMRMQDVRSLIRVETEE
jgi:hypothetical protein